MLFIMRIARVPVKGQNGPMTYGVVNTDNDVETLYTIDNLSGLAKRDPSLDIKGITPIGFIDGYNISVWQHPDYDSVKQAKLRALYRLEVIRYKDTITAISGEALAPVTLRLSDYGSRCGCGVLWRLQERSNQIVLVLDDNISIDRDAFYMPSKLTVRFDIREVTDKHTISRIYNPRWLNNLDAYNYFKKCIIDLPERFYVYVGRYIVKHKHPYNNGPAVYKGWFEDFDKALECISEDFRESFMKLCADGIHNCTRQLDRHDLMFMQPLKGLMLELKKQIASGESGLKIWRKHHVKFEKALKTASSVEINMYLCFFRYFIHLGGTDELRALGEKYVNDIIDWYLNGFPLWN